MYRIGVALSGGGYRAAAFHLGTMRKLNEMKFLDKVEVFSTVSGGSIVGADYVLQRNQKTDYFIFEENHIEKLKQSVIRRVLTSFAFLRIVLCLIIWLAIIIYFQFSDWAWVGFLMFLLGVLLLFNKQFQIFPVCKIIEGIYDKIFFTEKKLRDFPDTPVIAINSTNLETGRQFTFSKYRMGDSTYDYLIPPIEFISNNFPISRAVMASSGVPLAFTPVTITKEYFKLEKDTELVNPQLIDGGVFDNQGIHKLTHEKSRYVCDVVITSDAGNKMALAGAFVNLIKLLLRCLDLFMNRIKKFEMTDNLYYYVRLKKKQVAYISLGWNLENCISGFVNNLKDGLILSEVIQAHGIPLEYLNPFDPAKIQSHIEQSLNYPSLLKQQQSKEELDVARSVSTNLTALSNRQIAALINHAELMTEVQVKLYCPMLFKII